MKYLLFTTVVLGALGYLFLHQGKLPADRLASQAESLVSSGARDKPNGLVVVPDDGVQAFLDPLPISRLWGVGKATLPRFQKLGIRTFGDARQLSEAEFRRSFDEAGGQFFRLVRGIDTRQVVPDREAKSISHEVTP